MLESPAQLNGMTANDSNVHSSSTVESCDPEDPGRPDDAVVTTAQHQQMAKKIENGDFAEDYFASLSGPAKRLIEVGNRFYPIFHLYVVHSCFHKFDNW